MSGARSTGGQSSEMNTAMPRATGAPISSASTDEYSVPQMNGSAPNSPATGSQLLVRQKLKPNFCSDSEESFASVTPMPMTISSSAAANTPMPRRNPRSDERTLRL